MGYPKELNTIGDHIRKKRIELGLFQRQVAQRIGVGIDSVTNWEKGHSNPQLQHIPKVIEFLGYDPYQAQKNDSMLLGAKIKRYRRNHGMSQERLAERLNIDPTTLNKWECGKVTPSQVIHDRLSDFFEAIT